MDIVGRVTETDPVWSIYDVVAMHEIEIFGKMSLSEAPRSFARPRRTGFFRIR